MKRFHVHIRVKNLDESIQFYNTLFNTPASKIKTDYAKWMLEDPKVNFAISTGDGPKEIRHLGLQVENSEEQINVTEEADNQEVSEESINELDEASQLQSELNEQKDKYLRIYAEFENFKKRTRREKLDMLSTAARDTLSAMLPVLDDFDRAKKAAESDDTKEGFSEGVELVYNKFVGILSSKGLKAMESTGETFDPELHEAIAEIPAPSDDMKGKIIDTTDKGYFLNDKIIRHAKVVVGK